MARGGHFLTDILSQETNSDFLATYKKDAALASIGFNDQVYLDAITFHYPVFSTSPNRENEKLSDRFKPIFDKHKVESFYKATIMLTVVVW